MSKIFKKIAAIALAGVMAMSLVVTAGAETECNHTTWVAHVQGPYYERTSTHEHLVGTYTAENGEKYYVYKECIITTRYGQLYQVCQYCGKIMETRETSLGSTHSVS